MISHVHAGMETFPVSTLEISFDESVRKIAAEGASALEMAEDATRKMWKIVAPGKLEYQTRRRSDPSFHPKNIDPRTQPPCVPVQNSFPRTCCGTMHSMLALMFANAGIEGMGLLRCQLQYPNGELENHVNTILPPDKLDEFPHGALLAVNRRGRPHWSALEPGDFERFEHGKERPIFETGPDGDFLKEVRGPEIDF